MRSGPCTIIAVVALAACTTTAPSKTPIERIDEGIYHISVDGGDTQAGTRREVASLWEQAARSVCSSGYATLEDHATTETSDNVGWNMFGLPVAPGGTKTVNAKSGYVRCDDSPYGLADATFIVRDIKSAITLPPGLPECIGAASNTPSAFVLRAKALAEANDATTAFACFYRAASFGKDFRDGDPEAQFEVARRYERADGTVASPAFARTWYRRAAVNGHAGAAFRLSELAPQT
jgi:hypothetical protein